MNPLEFNSICINGQQFCISNLFFGIDIYLHSAQTCEIISRYLCFRKLKNKVILVINWKQLHVDCTALLNNVYIRLFSFQGGNTALHMAVARDQIGTVKILLQYKPLYSVPNNVSISIACGAVSITTCKSFLLFKLFSNHWNLYRLGLFSLCILYNVVYS